jgi:hypothetical protein
VDIWVNDAQTWGWNNGVMTGQVSHTYSSNACLPLYVSTYLVRVY